MSSGIKEFFSSNIFSGKTNSGLWQYPQRKLQPGVKIMQAVFSGKSSRVNF
jgi:hypothetical protein